MTYSTLRPYVVLLATLILTPMGCDPAPVDPAPAGSSGESSGSGDPTTGGTDSSTSESDTGLDSDSGTGEPTGTDTDTTGETEGDTETGPVDEGMFACGLPASCPAITWHLEPDDDFNAVRCAAELIVSSQPGVLRAYDVPGPSIWEEEMLIFVNGDGTVLSQTRERTCPGQEDCELSAQPWLPASTIRRCDILGIDELMTECARGGTCTWWPWESLECVASETPTCEDLAAILEP